MRAHPEGGELSHCAVKSLVVDAPSLESISQERWAGDGGDPASGIDSPRGVVIDPRTGVLFRPGEPAAEELSSTKREGLALCLSGGGYRATLFHLGATRRLHELGILGALNTISSVSGGSIFAGVLAGLAIGRGWPRV